MSVLYIIPTPIGNLEDITLRALRILKEEVQVIFCEDTRVFSKIINYYQIEGKKLFSLNKENEAGRFKNILDYLDNGINVGLASDAGTPLISDPGFETVCRFFAEENSKHQLVPLPGPSSLITALSVCPIDVTGFIFEGFLPHGPKQRRRVLKKLVQESPRPLVFFESPHRIQKTLEDIKNIFGDEAKIFLARELTKKFEELYFASVLEIQEKLETQFPKEVQGEFVLVLHRDKITPGAASPQFTFPDKNSD